MSKTPYSELDDLAVEEERQLQEAVRLIQAESEKAMSSAHAGLATKTSQGKKRKADGDGLDGNIRATRRPISPPTRSTRGSSISQFDMAYPNGALRITRTTGRANARNCINLSDVIHKRHLKAACIYAFFIAEEELYHHLPLSHTSDDIPIYIGRDPNFDPMRLIAMSEAKIPIPTGDKIPRKVLDSIRDQLQEIHSRKYGRKNLNTFYAFAPGSAHTKILLLVYSTFLRIVITSCNMMDIDTLLGDNHWYIHDVPKLVKPSNPAPSGFEADLLAHMEALGAPESFLCSIRGVYDYEAVKVDLITSVPGVASGVKAENHGLLRLRRVVNKLRLPLLEKESSGDLQLEVCTASVGCLTAKWLAMFHDCILGKENLQASYDGSAVPNMKLFFPTTSDVKSATEQAQEGASNIGCHLRPWNSAPVELKRIFRHYKSKDEGCLFHQKFFLAYNAQHPDQLPYFVYVGSANLSQSAWGMLEHDKRGNTATGDKKLTKVTNFECGVLIPGYLISGLLEDGTTCWQDGIVPHLQSTPKYDLSKDKAWNSPDWVVERNRE